MNFYDINFIVFIIPIMIFLSLYSDRIKLVSLIFISIIFYLLNAPEYILLLFLSIFINYVIGLFIYQNKLILAFSIILNVTILIYYKYIIFLLNIFGIEIQNIQSTYLPLGISFFTFQQINYLIDRYNNTIKEKSISKYSLFIIFFPQLIAGPILRYNNFYQNIKSEKYKRINIFLIILSIALFKKIFLANNLAPISDSAFNSINDLSQIDSWLAAIAYHFEIYFDFSAYCDFAIAAGYLMGYKIPINFNSPYKKLNIISFWRSWNITVSNFFRQNIYNFLGYDSGNKSIFRYLAIILTMLVSGLWHGASFNFILWGGAHGIAIVINHIYRRFKFNFINKIAAFLIMQIFLIFSWVIFKTNNISETLNFWKKMTSFEVTTFNLVNITSAAVIFASISIIYLTPNSYVIFRKLRAAKAINIKYLLLSSLIIFITFLNTASIKQFIYFDF